MNYKIIVFTKYDILLYFLENSEIISVKSIQANLIKSFTNAPIF